MRWLDRHVLISAAMVGGVGLCCSRVTQAAWISEFSPQTRRVYDRDRHLVTLPGYVEVTGLSRMSTADLVLVDAVGSTRYGNIRQVITLPADPLTITAATTAGPDVRLVSLSHWPATVYPNKGLTASAGTEVFTAWAGGSGVAGESGGGSFNIYDGSGQRVPVSLLLFDAPTGLSAGSKISPATFAAGIPAHVYLLDVLTLNGSNKSAQTWDTETPLIAGVNDMVTALPLSAQDIQRIYLTGAPDWDDQLTDYTPAYQVNPGLINVPWTAPEPTALAGVGGLGSCCLSRARRRRCPDTSPSFIPGRNPPA